MKCLQEGSAVPFGSSVSWIQVLGCSAIQVNPLDLNLFTEMPEHF